MRNLFAYAFCWACVAAAHAGSFSVQPVRVELSSSARTAAITVVNGSAQEPAVVQLQAYTWTQENGQDVYTSTNEVLATPPIFTLAPGGSQIVRVGIRRNFDPSRELTYRLYFTEVPRAPQPGFHGLQVALRIGLPVFVQPVAQQQLKLAWQLTGVADNRFKLHVQNHGNVHAQILNFDLFVAGTEKRIAANHTPAYVLPGQSREWTVKGDTPPPMEDTPIRLLAVTSKGNVETGLQYRKR